MAVVKCWIASWDSLLLEQLTPRLFASSAAAAAAGTVVGTTAAAIAATAAFGSSAAFLSNMEYVT